MALHSISKNLFRLFLRRTCPGCGSDREQGELFCPWCSLRIERCGTAHWSGSGLPAGSSEPSGVLVHSSVLFTGIPGEILRRLKFDGEKHLASAAAGIILDHSRILPAEGDLLVPVPAGRSRRRERGYNQAALISRRLACLTGASSDEMLARKDGPSQVGLSFTERRKNVEGAFRLKRRKAVRKDVRIWVVDDVATTFSTIHSAATALLDSGFEAVCGLTLAYRRKTAGSIIRL